MPFTSSELAERTLHRRAVEAAIWGTPAVNFDRMYQAIEAPSGKESNWVPTSTDGKFEVLFRLYGPEKPLFDKAWKLPDIEKM